MKKFRKPQMTQYPAATPKAKAATIVSRSRDERKNVVISTQSIFPARPDVAASEDPGQAASRLFHATEPLIRCCHFTAR